MHSFVLSDFMVSRVSTSFSQDNMAIDDEGGPSPAKANVTGEATTVPNSSRAKSTPVSFPLSHSSVQF